MTVILCGTPLTESAPAGTESRSFAVRETLFLHLPAGWKTLRGKHLRKQRICGTIGFVEAIFKIASYGGVAQLGEHHVRNVGVMGSNPTVSISIKPRKYVVSHVGMRFAGFLLPKKRSIDYDCFLNPDKISINVSAGQRADLRSP